MEQALENRRKMKEVSPFIKQIRKTANDSFGIYITIEEAEYVFENSSYVGNHLSINDFTNAVAEEFITRFINLYGQMQFAHAP